MTLDHEPVPMGIRAILGFLVGAIAVVTFPQPMVFVLCQYGLVPCRVFELLPDGPFYRRLEVPPLVQLMFWRGLYGAMLGLLWPRLELPPKACGLILGVIASGVEMFIFFSRVEGAPFDVGWWVRGIPLNVLINGFWGLGVGLIAPFLLPRRNTR